MDRKRSLPVTGGVNRPAEPGTLGADPKEYTGDNMPTWIQLVTPVVTIAGFGVWILHTLWRLETQLQHIDVRLCTVEFQNRALLKAVPQIISSLITAHAMTVEQGTQVITTALDTAPIPDFLRNIKPTVNPLSQADVNQLQSYVARLKLGQALTVSEAQDFYRISDIITREYPNNEGSWLLFLIGGILLGAMIASANK